MLSARIAFVIAAMVALLAHAPAAYGAPGDPPAGSPAGAVYVLPLEEGRSDAAPKEGSLFPAGGGGSEGGGGAGGNTVASGADATGADASGGSLSLYRSENNFGSSSRVPGLAVAQRGADGGTAESGMTGTRGSGLVAPARIADAGNTSVAGSIALLAAIGLVAVAIGALSARPLTPTAPITAGRPGRGSP